MKAAIALLIILIIIAAIFGGMYVGRKNQMVTLDEQVKSNWSQVDVQLQRRADLIGEGPPPAPADPIKARWMGIAGGAGIHGTDEVGSLGSAASHGCIRMAIPDVIALFDQVNVGDPVFIS